MIWLYGITLILLSFSARKPVLSTIRSKSGFTLIEVSIVLAILSVVITSLLPLLLDANRKADEDITLERMARIEQAMLAYYAANTKLPCPAPMAVGVRDSNFGKAANHSGAAPGSCVDGTAPNAAKETNTAFAGVTKVAYGMVPIRNLGLADEYAFDGFQRRFSYFVSLASVENGSNGQIIVEDMVGADRMTNAAFVIMSHGPNGHGGVGTSSSGTVKSANLNSTNRELENCDCDSDAVAYSPATNVKSFEKRGHVVAQSMSYGEELDAFDDVVNAYTIELMDQLTTP